MGRISSACSLYSSRLTVLGITGLPALNMTKEPGIKLGKSVNGPVPWQRRMHHGDGFELAALEE
jgi:hypothetical protein